MSGPGLADYARMARASGPGRAWSYFWENHVFDLVWGVDTAHWRPDVADHLPNASHARGYEASYTRQIRRALALAAREASLGDLDFVDLGCGKAKTLIVAAGQGCRSVSGVEFDPHLASVARANLARLGIAGAVEEADVAGFEGYGRKSLVYLFNPFDAEIVAAAARRIERACEFCVLVYTHPAHPGPFAGWRERPGLTSRRSYLTTRVWLFERPPLAAAT